MTMNYVHILGRIGKDAETRVTTNGNKVTSFAVATNTRVGDKDETIWWRVNGWGDRFEKMCQYLTKGKPIMAGGTLKKPEIYKDANGNSQISSLDIRADYINFVPSTGVEGQEKSNSPYGGQSQDFAPSAHGMGSHSSADEGIPF